MLQRWKSGFFVVLGLLLLSNLFWLYALLNASVDQSSKHIALEQAEQAKSVLSKLLLDREEPLYKYELHKNLLDHLSPTEIIDRDNQLVVDGLSFIFAGERLVNIK